MLSKAWQGLSLYFYSLWELRFFWISLVKAELQRRYRRSVLGLGWSLIQPLSMTLVLGIVYRKLFNYSFWEFAPLLLCGLAFWNMISQSILRGCSSLTMCEHYIRQQPLPLVMFPLREVLVVGFHFLISLALTLVIVWPVKWTFPMMGLVGLFPTLILLFLLGWSLAVLGGFAHAFFPDTQHLAEVGLQVLMYLTPIMYPPELLAKNGLSFLLHCNPLAVFLEMLRDSVLHNQIPAASTYALATLFVAVPLACASYVVAKYEHRIVFVL